MNTTKVVSGLVLIALALAGCGTTGPAVQGPSIAEAPVQEAPPDDGFLSFDEAVAEAVRAVEAKAAARTVVAVVRIDAPSDEFSRYLKDELDVNLDAGGRLKVVGRGSELQLVLDEQDLQYSDLADEKSAVRLGKLLGARLVITGAWSGFDAFSQLRLKAIDVETGAYAATYSGRIRNSSVPIKTK